MKLYELTRDWLALQERLDDADELTHDEIARALNAIDEARDKKIENCVKLVKHYSALQMGVRMELERMRAYSERLEKAGESIKAYLAGCMMDGERFQSHIGEVSWRHSEAVVSDENAEIPEAYRRTKTVIEADKRAIKADLECGADIPGWRIEKRKHILVRLAFLALLIPGIARAEQAPDGCYRTNLHPFECWTPSDGITEFGHKGSAALNSIAYGAAIGGLVEGKQYAERLAGAWRDYALAQTENVINLDYKRRHCRRKLRRAKSLIK